MLVPENATIDFDLLRKKWVHYLVGNNQDTSSPEVQAVVASLEKTAEARIGYVAEPPVNTVFTTPYYTLHALAKAYKTPGSKYYAKQETQKFIISELGRLQDEEYNMDSSAENWWAVEIGIPRRILDILILLYDELDDREALITKHTDIILNFQDAYTNTASGMVETGANLAWKCRVIFLTGVLRKDPQLLAWVSGKLPSLLCYSEGKPMPGVGFLYDDGFYPDGSFVQHYFFAYTGGYGKNFITTLGGLLYAFGGTGALDVPKENLEFLWKIIFEAYEPLIYKGRFLDIARGRESSRFYHQDYIAGRHTIRGLCYLAAVMPPAEKARAHSMIKEWLLADADRLSILRDEDGHAEHFVYGSLVPLVREILDDATAPRGELLLHKSFGVTANVVHLTKNYGLAVKMYSPSIACYEYLSGESQKFWHMSDGVTYLYTKDIDGYGNEYYATVDMQRLPGTTVDRSPTRAQDEYFSWYMPDSKNVYAFAGGTDLDGLYGIAGMQYRGQGIGKTRDLEVKKSWFMFDEEILCLGSGISSTTGNPIETILDNRLLIGLTENQISIDGKAGTPCARLADQYAQQPYKGVSSLHLSGNKGAGIGWVFPQRSDVHLLCEHRVGTWNSVEVYPENQKENDFATLWLSHGQKPENASYAYVLLPEKSAEETLAYAKTPELEIVENSAQAHAARHKRLRILGVNFWCAETYTSAGITSSGQCGLMLRQSGEACTIAMSDPAKSESVLEISFPVDAAEILDCDERIEILEMAPLTVRFNTQGAHRQSFHLHVSIKTT